VISAISTARRLLARSSDGYETEVVAYTAENFSSATAQHVLRLVAAGQVSGQHGG
jgi:hypothetical protein